MYVSKNYYGGDAYTGIQHAAAETGQNVRDLARINRFGFGSILLIGGLALIAFGIPGNNKEIDEENEKKEDKSE